MDLSGDTVGGQPSQFSPLYGTLATALAVREVSPGGARYLEVSGASNRRWSFDPAGSLTDVELYTVWSTTTTTYTCYNLLRADAALHTYYVGLIYNLQLHYLYRFVNNAAAALANPSMTVASGAKFHKRMQAQGNVIRQRYWLDGQAEPSTWQEYTDADAAAILGAGLVGIGSQAGTDNRLHHLEVTAL